MDKKFKKAIKNKINDIKKIKIQASALTNYPELYSQPEMLKNAVNDYNSIKAPNGEIEKLYNTLPYKLTADDKSNIRHPYTNAKFVRKYPENFVRQLGIYKEDVDQRENKPILDTKGDLINNEYGIRLGKKYPNAPDIILFDKILTHFDMPVPARNNTLYGYITNTAKENGDEENFLYNQIKK